MIHLLSTIAHTSETVVTDAATHAEEAGGLAALGLDVKSFLFQLVTFVLLLLILRKWAFPVLVRTLEERRLAVEKSIDQAKHTEAAMHDAEKKIAGMLTEARDEAAGLVAAGQREAAKLLEEAETRAATRAEHIVKEARTSMEHEVAKAKAALKKEAAELVAEATSVIVKEKVDAGKNADLIAKALHSPQKDRT